MGLPATLIRGRRMPSLPWLVYLTEQLSARADRAVAGEPVTGGGHKDRAGLSRLAKVAPKPWACRRSPIILGAGQCRARDGHNVMRSALDELGVTIRVPLLAALQPGRHRPK